MTLRSLARNESESADTHVTGMAPESVKLRSAIGNIVIVCAVPLLRLGFASIISESAALDSYIVSTFATLPEAEEKISKVETGDVVILDLNAWSSLSAPGNSAAFEGFKERAPALGLITSIKPATVSHLAASGVCGLLPLEAELDDFISMVTELSESRNYFGQEAVPGVKPARMALLSPHQLDVLELMTKGLSNKQIAAELGISVATVKGHVSKIFKKLDCRWRTQAIMTFIQSC